MNPRISFCERAKVIRHLQYALTHAYAFTSILYINMLCQPNVAADAKGNFDRTIFRRASLDKHEHINSRQA